MNVLGMGPLELLLILALALIVFGPAKLPEIARQIGRVVGELRHASAEVTREFERSLEVDSKVQSPESSVPRAGADTRPEAAPPSHPEPMVRQAHQERAHPEPVDHPEPVEGERTGSTGSP